MGLFIGCAALFIIFNGSICLGKRDAEIRSARDLWVRLYARRVTNMITTYTGDYNHASFHTKHPAMLFLLGDLLLLLAR